MDSQFNGNAVDEVLAKFVAYKVHQPAISEPKTLGGWIYATNTHAIAMVKKTETLTEYAPHELSVTVIQPILERDPATDSGSVRIPLSALKEAYEGIETKHERIPDRKCPECRGDGFTTCYHCNSEVECKECQGEGMLYVPNKFTVEFEYGHAVKIGEAFLQPRYVKWLVESAEILGEKSVTHTRWEEREEEISDVPTPEGEEPAEPRKYPYYQEFRVGPVRVGIMPIKTAFGCSPDDHQVHEVAYPVTE